MLLSRFTIEFHTFLVLQGRHIEAESYLIIIDSEYYLNFKIGKSVLSIIDS